MHEIPHFARKDGHFRKQGGNKRWAFSCIIPRARRARVLELSLHISTLKLSKIVTNSSNIGYKL